LNFQPALALFDRTGRKTTLGLQPPPPPAQPAAASSPTIIIFASAYHELASSGDPVDKRLHCNIAFLCRLFLHLYSSHCFCSIAQVSCLCRFQSGSCERFRSILDFARHYPNIAHRDSCRHLRSHWSWIELIAVIDR
jgi:hypothetical protein